MTTLNLKTRKSRTQFIDKCLMEGTSVILSVVVAQGVMFYLRIGWKIWPELMLYLF